MTTNVNFRNFYGFLLGLKLIAQIFHNRKVGVRLLSKVKQHTEELFCTLNFTPQKLVQSQSATGLIAIQNL